MAKCNTCKNRNKDDFLFCDYCIHQPDLTDKYEPVTVADRIRTLDDNKMAKFLAKMLANYTIELYNEEYTPSDKVVDEITSVLLMQLKETYEEE